MGKLLTTTWSQGTTENYYTPLNRPCGCVATAGAQIMHYHKWPQSGITAITNYNSTVDGIGTWTLERGYQTAKNSAFTPWSPAFGGPYNWSGMTSGDATTAITDENGIYALKLAAGNYVVGLDDGAGNAAVTNLTVATCVSLRTVDDLQSGAFYPGTDSVGNMHGVELKLAALAAPVIYPAGSTTFYGAARHVSISCADKLAEIRYTTDGSEPTTASALYDEPFTVSATTTVKAKTFTMERWASATTTATLTKTAYYDGLYPDDKASRAAHWLDERAAMQEATGMWSNAVEYVDGKVTIDEENEFTIADQSGEKRTTIFLNVTFDWLASDRGADPDDVKAGVRISTNGCFQVYAFVDGARKWIDVTAADVTPRMGTDYTVKLVLSNMSRSYKAAIVSGTTEIPLVAVGGARWFPYANQSNSAVESILFKGEGKVQSLEGSYGPSKTMSATIR